MDNKEFRNAMGKFATGVTVITTKTGEEIHGMTANAFMSVSLDPKLVTISIDHRAKMLDKVKSSGMYAVNILTSRQLDISMHFANQKSRQERIEFDFHMGIPVLKDALAVIICKVEHTYEIGDHTLFIGKVQHLSVRDGKPLTFYGGQYGTIEPLVYEKT